MFGILPTLSLLTLQRVVLLCRSLGGNVSAHASHVVGSALADPFASYAAGMAGLGGTCPSGAYLLKWMDFTELHDHMLHLMLETNIPP